MSKILSLGQLRNIEIDHIVNLYRNGYRMGGHIYSEFKLQEAPLSGTATVTLIVATKDGPISQAFVYVNGNYRGITDREGRFTINNLEVVNTGTSHIFQIARPGFNTRPVRILLFPDIDVTYPVLLTDNTPGKGSILFQVNCLGSPCEGATIILMNQEKGDIELGKTGSDGTLFVEGLDTGYNIPYVIRKEGFEGIYGYLLIENQFTLSAQFSILPNPEAAVRFATVDKDGIPICCCDVSIDDVYLGMTDETGNLTVSIDPKVSHQYIVSKAGFKTIYGMIDPILAIKFIPIIMSASITT